METSIASIAIAAALAWASGLRLYAVLFIIGLSGYFGWFEWKIPASFALISHPLVICANGLLLTCEFFADKIPGFDSLWDAIHTFIRIPAGALLAAGIIGAEDNAAWTIAAALLGGSITAGTHFLKAGSRAAINASPEPVSNWTASFTEDTIVLGGLWLAFQHPGAFLMFLLLSALVAAWLLPKLVRFCFGVLRRLGRLLAGARSA